jgi:peptide/nickel transport system ATP-binding protein
MSTSTLLPDTTETPGRPSAPARSGHPALRIEDLRVTVYDGRREAVRGVSLQVQPGEAVGLVGESGSGKTLTCRAALGVLAPGCRIESGSIELDGADVTKAPRKDWDRLWGSAVGAVFQDPASYLNPSLPVGRQLTEVLRRKLGLPRREARDRAIALFTSVGLHRPELVFGQLPAELSGGMLQRVLLSIAIAAEPRLLVADEATTALDVTIQAEVIELIAGLRKERDLAVLFVSHDLAVVAEVCDRIVVFYAGEVVESGPTEQILQNPRHPYTQALLRVASVGDYGRRALDVIPGAPPSIGTELPGCRFAPRCSFAAEACTAGPVALVDLGGPVEHQSRCLRVDELPAVHA